MARIRINKSIGAPPSLVWDCLADLATHPRWMKDAVGLEFLSEKTAGIGTRMIVPTRVGPFRTSDILEVVEWTDGESIGVRHTGMVSGTGEFRILSDGSGTQLTWAEELRFPWWLGGVVTARLARPVLSRIWQGNLDRFADLVEQP